MIAGVSDNERCMCIVLHEQGGTVYEAAFGFVGSHFDGDVTADAVRLANASDDDAHELPLVCVEEVDANAAAR